VTFKRKFTTSFHSFICIDDSLVFPGKQHLNSTDSENTASFNNDYSWAPVAYNPSYSGGRDQEDLGLKPALGK
jgi:hypothetical protein